VLVPVDFDVPRSFAGPGFRLEPLGPEHNERDHVAWMSSIDHIRSTPGLDAWEGQWPTPMTPDDNLADLVRHRAEFEAREAFAYSILDDDEVIGCLYIDPIKGRPGDAQVVSWVRASRTEMDRTVWGSISAWLAADWPFTGFTYAARA
jgi:RimJ/RimL family protein N-acetyltransferase